MSEPKDVEERLRAALRARAGDFTVSPDAWPLVLARRGDATVGVPAARSGWRHRMIPLAAAAAVVIAVGAGVLLHSVVHGGGSPLPRPSAPVQPAAQPSPVPDICPTTPAPPPNAALAGPPALTVISRTALASLPARVRYFATHVTVPYTDIVRVREDLAGTAISAYVWYSHQTGQPGAARNVIISAESFTPAGHAQDEYAEQYQVVPGLGGGQVVSLGGAGDLLSASNASAVLRFDIASSRVATVTLTPKDDRPVQGTVFTAPGFPHKVWMIAVPRDSDWPSTLTFRDGAGQVVASGPWVGYDAGSSCHPIAFFDYETPHDGHAYSLGGSLPEVTSVTAVLPDGRKIAGVIQPRPIVQQYYQQWQVTYPAADANLKITLVFRNASGQVLDTLTAVPAKNPYPTAAPTTPWW